MGFHGSSLERETPIHSRSLRYRLEQRYCSHHRERVRSNCDRRDNDQPEWRGGVSKFADVGQDARHVNIAEYRRER